MKKKTLLATLLIFYSCLQFTFAQTPAAKPENETPDKAKPTFDREIFDNPVYFKIGVSAPLGTFGQTPVATRPISDSFNGLDGTGAKTGLDLEMGLISYLSDPYSEKRFRFGIDAGFAASFNQLNWQDLGGGYSQATYNPFIFAGLKLGPAISYNIVNKVIIDGFLKVNPVYSNGGKIAFSETTGNRSDFLTIAAEKTIAIRESAGINIRYGAYLFGAEYNFGTMKYKYSETGYSLINNATTPSYPYFNVYKSKTPTSLLLITGGLKF